jgi:hypothetical protein
MSQAQTPAEAARWPVELALSDVFDPAFYGELVQFGRVLEWSAADAVAHVGDPAVSLEDANAL